MNFHISTEFPDATQTSEIPFIIWGKFTQSLQSQLELFSVNIVLQVNFVSG